MTARRAGVAAVLVACVAAAGALSVFELRNDDAGFHIATGRYILETGEVPDRNPFSYAEDGHAWIQHQWIPAVAMARIVDLGGIRALVLAKAACIVAVFAVLAAWLWRRRLPAGAALLLLGTAVAASCVRFYARPYLVSLLGLAVTSVVLLHWKAGGLRGWRAPAAALVATVLNLHLHAGGLYALLVWVALAGGEVAEWLADRAGWRPEVASAPAPGRAAAGLAATVAATVVSLALLAPSGLGVLALPMSLSADAYWHEHLVEFRALPLRGEAALLWIAVAIAGATAAVAAWWRHGLATCLALGFGVLALRHMRLVAPMAVVVTAAAAAVLSAPAWLERLRARRLALPMAAAGAALLAVGAIQQDRRFDMGVGEAAIDARYHALELIATARRAPPEVFVSDGLAGTWLWRNFRAFGPDGAPLPPKERRRVLIHNCLECYDEATYIDLYQHIRYGRDGWRELVDRLGIRSFLLEHTSPGERRLQQGRANVRQHLFTGERWVLVDFTDAASLYVERAARPDDLPALEGFPVDPDSGRRREGASYAEVREALLEHADRHPEDLRPLRFLLRHALRVGDRRTANRAAEMAADRAPDHPTTRAMVRTLRAAGS